MVQHSTFPFIAHAVTTSLSTSIVLLFPLSFINSSRSWLTPCRGLYLFCSWTFLCYHYCYYSNLATYIVSPRRAYTTYYPITHYAISPTMNDHTYALVNKIIYGDRISNNHTLLLLDCFHIRPVFLIPHVW